MLLRIVKKLGGRKYALVLILTILFLAFGVYVVEKGADLSHAALFIGAIGGTAGAYWHNNVKQKNGVQQGTTW